MTALRNRGTRDVTNVTVLWCKSAWRHRCGRRRAGAPSSGRFAEPSAGRLASSGSGGRWTWRWALCTAPLPTLAAVEPVLHSVGVGPVVADQGLQGVERLTLAASSGRQRHAAHDLGGSPPRIGSWLPSTSTTSTSAAFSGWAEGALLVRGGPRASPPFGDRVMNIAYRGEVVERRRGGPAARLRWPPENPAGRVPRPVRVRGTRAQLPLRPGMHRRPCCTALAGRTERGREWRQDGTRDHFRREPQPTCAAGKGI